LAFFDHRTGDTKQLLALAVVVNVAIFVADLNVPLGVASGMMYVVPVLIGGWFPKRRYIFALAAGGSLLTLLGLYMSPAGGIYWVVLTNRAMALVAIWLTAILLAYRLSERHRSEITIKKQKEWTDFAIGKAKIGIWEWDIKKDQYFWDIHLQELFNVKFDDNKKIKTTDFYNAIHPDDRDKIETAKTEALAGKNDYEIDYRVIWPDGSIHWLNSRANLIRDEYGEPTKFIGVCIDITDRKFTGQALAKNEERFKSFAQSAADRFWETDRNSRYIYVSPPSGRLTRVTKELLGKTPWEVIGAESDNWDILKQMFFNREPIRDFHFVWTGDDTQPRYLQLNAIPYFDENGFFAGHRGSTVDETSEVLARQESRTIQQRFHDAMDGLDISMSLWDSDQKLIFSNKAEIERQGETGKHLVPGVDLGEFLQHVANKRQQLGILEGEIEEWCQNTLQEFTKNDSDQEFLISGERWIRGRRKKLSDGSIASIHFDITEAKLREREFELARSEADEANRAKSEFLASMSHELRTPMNAILGFGQLLQNNPGEPLSEVQFDHTQQILKGGDHLLDLIDQVLELSKVEAGNINLAIENVVPQEIIEESLNMVLTLAHDKGVSLEFDSSNSEFSLLWTDKNRFRQILLNLLSNAIKYNQVGGSVSVTAEKVNEKNLRISVADTGSGIPQEIQAGLFEPFDRLGREAGEIEGSGIGLTITRQLIDIMDGDIGFESTEGSGSIFWIELPLSRAQSEDLFTAATDSLNTSFDKTANSAGTILYIEDNPANLLLMETIVKRLPNLTMKSAHTAEIGLYVARDIHPDLIIMDINLPGLDGITALNRLRDNKHTSDIPVIAVGASVMSHEVEQAKSAGFDEFIIKPIKIHEVLNAISDQLPDSTPIN
jgi:signal transduction histidine kinase/ActR/RegA family two-component response regulator